MRHLWPEFPGCLRPTWTCLQGTWLTATCGTAVQIFALKSGPEPKDLNIRHRSTAIHIWRSNLAGNTKVELALAAYSLVCSRCKKHAYFTQSALHIFTDFVIKRRLCLRASYTPSLNLCWVQITRGHQCSHFLHEPLSRMPAAYRQVVIFGEEAIWAVTAVFDPHRAGKGTDVSYKAVGHVPYSSPFVLQDAPGHCC